MFLRVSLPNLTSITERTVQPRDESATKGYTFSSALQKASATLEALDRELVQAQTDLVSGNARDMHTAVLAAEKASLALDLVISVRNKAIEAYQEIMRMPL